MSIFDCDSRDDPRGQSEVIGYVMVFGLVITLIGMSVALGGTALDSAQATAEVDVADRHFERINNEAVTIRTNDSRSVIETETPPGQLKYGNITTIVTVTGDVDGSETNLILESRPMVYTTTDKSTVVRYDMGIIARQRSPGGDTSYSTIPDQGLSISEFYILGPADVDSIRWIIPEYRMKNIYLIRGNRAKEYILTKQSRKPIRTIQFDSSDQIEITIQTTETELWEEYAIDHPGLAVRSVVENPSGRDTVKVKADTEFELSVSTRPVLLR